MELMFFFLNEFKQLKQLGGDATGECDRFTWSSMSYLYVGYLGDELDELWKAQELLRISTNNRPACGNQSGEEYSHTH